MSRVKDYLIMLCHERDLALSRIGDGECENMTALFSGYGSLIPPSPEFDQIFPHCDHYTLLLTQINNAMEVARYNSDHHFKRVVYNMAYSHSVTLLETFISQSLVALAKQNSAFVTRITQHYDPTAVIKKDGWRKVLESPGGLAGLVIEGLSNDVFHNLKTVKNLFGLMFEEEGKGVCIGPMEVVINRRHDIVHRNGTSMTGELLTIQLEMLEHDVGVIKSFANELKERMTAGVIAVVFR